MSDNDTVESLSDLKELTGDAPAAEAWVEASLDLSRLKDAAMTSGPVTIVSSDYGEVAYDSLSGWTVRKTVRLGSLPRSPTQEVCVLTASHDALVFEVSAIEAPDGARRTLALASLLLDADEAARDDGAPARPDAETR